MLDFAGGSEKAIAEREARNLRTLVQDPIPSG